MLHSDLPFLPDRMKVNNVNKLVCNLNDKENYSVHILTLKQALNHDLKLKRVHSVIEFRQECWLKPYIDLNTDLRKDARNEFENDFYKRMNNSVSERPWKMLEIIEILHWLQRMQEKISLHLNLITTLLNMFQKIC